MNTQIFDLNKYDLKGHKSSSNFTVNPTLPLLDGPLIFPFQIVCISLYLALNLVLSSPLLLSLYIPLLLHANIYLYRSEATLMSRNFKKLSDLLIKLQP